jgi:hypothetical protein
MGNRTGLKAIEGNNAQRNKSMEAQGIRQVTLTAMRKSIRTRGRRLSLFAPTDWLDDIGVL